MVDAPPSAETTGDLLTVLSAALAAGTRAAFSELLSEDVHWGGERRGGEGECVNRTQAADYYAGMLAAGVTLRVDDLRVDDPVDGGEVVTVGLLVRSADPDSYPPTMRVRLTLRDGLIGDIRVLEQPDRIEVLYFDGCPHHEALLPHLYDLLREHDIDATIILTPVDTDDDAQARRFLGSPTVRVNGVDVEPAVAETTRDDGPDRPDQDSPYGVQCRLYRSADGVVGVPDDQWILDALVDNPVHQAAIVAVHEGHVAALQSLLLAHPGLASTRLARRDGRTLLHVATDWPSHFPNVADVIAALVAGGADPDTPSLGEHAETPLHWAASSNDVAALDALLDAGADINAAGAVIAGGTPMADATAFGQWDAARRLLERGAVTNLFEAAALGLTREVQRHLDTNHPTHDTITSSFWGACHGGHLTTASLLLDHGADLTWIGYDGLTPLDAARRSPGEGVVAWLQARGATGADEISPES